MDVRGLLESFGAVKHLHLTIAADGAQAFAFAEFIDPNVTDIAINELNGVPVGEKPVRIIPPARVRAHAALYTPRLLASPAPVNGKYPFRSWIHFKTPPSLSITCSLYRLS